MRDYPPAPQVRIGDHACVPTMTQTGPSPGLIRYARIKMITEAVGAGVVGAIFAGWAALAIFLRHEFGGPQLEAYSYVTVVCGVGVATATTGAITTHLFGRAAITHGVVDLTRLRGVLALGKAWQWATASICVVMVVTAVVVVLNTDSDNMLLILIQAAGMAAGVLASSTATVRTTLRLLTSVASPAVVPGTAGQRQWERRC